MPLIGGNTSQVLENQEYVSEGDMAEEDGRDGCDLGAAGGHPICAPCDHTADITKLSAAIRVGRVLDGA